MPITAFKDYSLTYTPSYTTSYRKATLVEALHSVVQGELGTMYLFTVLPRKVRKIINKVCQASFGKDFKQLAEDEQKGVVTILLLALQTQNSSSTDKPRTKKWWQFSR